MAIISDTTKIDKSFKFASGKAYTTNQKGVDNEDAPSGFIIGTSSIFSQDAGIPGTAPGASTSILTYFDDGTVLGRYKMTYDISSPLNRAWYASSDGSTLTQMRATRQGNWVPPTFGNYTIRIFLTVGPSTTSPISPGSAIEIFFSDATSPLFDYKSGILTFESNPIGPGGAYPSYDGVQIGGYRYTGPLLSQIFDGNGNFTGGLSDFGTSSSLAKFVNPGKSFEVSSPNAISSSFTEEASALFSVYKNVFQLPNGTIIAVGDQFGPAITYSYGASSKWFSPNIVSYGGATTLLAVWAPDNTNVYIGAGGGSNGLLRSTNGGADWNTMTDPSIGTVKAIWGSSINDIYILGSSPNGGAISHSANGTTFSAQTSGTTNNLVSVWGSSSSDIYAVGASGTIRHSTGAGTWTGHTSGTANDLKGVFGLSPTAVYAVGNNGTVLSSHVLGTWVAETGLPGTFFATGVWGSSIGGVTRLYISGNTNSGAGPGAMYTSNGGGTWTLMTTLTGGQLATSIYGGPNGVYVGSNNGNIECLHQDPVLHVVNGNTVIDGYVSVGLSIQAKYANLGMIDSGTINATTSSPGLSTIYAVGPTNGTAISGVVATTGGTGLYVSTQLVGIGADVSGGTSVGSVGIQARNQVNRDTLGVSSIQQWYGQNNSGSQLVGTMDSFGSFTLTGYIDMLENTAPATPSATHARIYMRSNGLSSPNHRTQLVVKWPGTGIETVITESPAS